MLKSVRSSSVLATLVAVVLTSTPLTASINGFDEASPSLNITQPGAVTTAGELIISEFRLRGPFGANDEFIELYNTTGAAMTVASLSGTGLGVASSDGLKPPPKLLVKARVRVNTTKAKRIEHSFSWLTQ